MLLNYLVFHSFQCVWLWIHFHCSCCNGTYLTIKTLPYKYLLWLFVYKTHKMWIPTSLRNACMGSMDSRHTKALFQCNFISQRAVVLLTVCLIWWESIWWFGHWFEFTQAQKIKTITSKEFLDIKYKCLRKALQKTV